MPDAPRVLVVEDDPAIRRPHRTAPGDDAATAGDAPARDAGRVRAGAVRRDLGADHASKPFGTAAPPACRRRRRAAAEAAPRADGLAVDIVWHRVSRDGGAIPLMFVGLAGMRAARRTPAEDAACPRPHLDGPDIGCPPATGG